MTIKRPQYQQLLRRLREPRRFIQAVTGPRQVGKTTLVQQVAEGHRVPYRYVSADEPTLRDHAWIGQQWEAARLLADESRGRGALLVIDEVQKLQGWSQTVKKYWDEDTHQRRNLKLVLLGSAPLLVARGLSESLAGRFEINHLPHWTFSEMENAFDWSLDKYIFHGGYPGAALLVDDPGRWTRYVMDSLVETTVSRDVLLLSRVDKPSLLRRLFELACRYSGQILSYTKMLGQLQDAGNVTTLAHYLDLLSGAGMVTGLHKFAREGVRTRGSSPKLQVFNTALVSAQNRLSIEEARKDGTYWGRLVESAIGAHLANASAAGECEVYYWRDRNSEVDFIVRSGRSLTAIEVKSGRAKDDISGMSAFVRAFKPKRTLLVGSGGIGIDQFLSKPVEHWIA